ncbi:MAG: chromosome segregation protein SMC [Gammaproteobacteria bacterium]|nr:chromosome segregation protein SMC [Gammaproteobacteria bacterium]
MRLSKIKLAGFKSFVDPTTVHFPSNLVGVVGPNGCGKSNVIDAIRWVMGETSARHLRGESMEDVIFNGSSSRKPVGSAAIELYFDNSDGTLDGQFASYAEISIRRTVSRDGISQYFLNNTRCRRKDITGLFMGTGLGPRSYAIIEQGMVSRLVEAKPEEMRSYIEEAAGISKYKERRRETEIRMNHTRENLARLADLRDEVEKQIKHLQRQAQVAEKYRMLKQQERQLEAELLVIRLSELDRGLGSQRLELSSRQTAMDAALAGQRQVELDIETARAEHVVASDAFSATQAAYYAVQGEIARLEQTLAHARELRERELRDLAQTRTELSTVLVAVEHDNNTLAEIDRGIAGFEPGLAAAREAEAAANACLLAGERALDAWQEQWHTYNLDVKEQQQARQVEQTRLEHLEAHQTRLSRQLQSVEGERLSISVVDLEARLTAQDLLQADTQQLISAEAKALEGAGFTLSSQREAEQRLGSEIEQLRGELEARRGRLDALRVIQNAALGNEEEILGGWLTSSGLADRKRLVQQLAAEPQWTRAVETVLGDFLQAVCVDDAGRHAASLPDATLVLVEDGGAEQEAPADSLAARVQRAGNLHGVLAAVRCADSVDEALRRRGSLRAGQSVITQDGVWIGPGWVRVNRGQRYVGMMAREREIRELDDALAGDETQIAVLGKARLDLRGKIEALERERDQIQLRLADANRQSLESASMVATLHQDLERARQRLEVLAHDGESVRVELAELRIVIDEARERLGTAERRLDELELQRPELRERQDTLLATYNDAREGADARRTAVGQIVIEFESRRAAQGAATAALERVIQQRDQLAERITTLELHTRDSEPPLRVYQQELDEQLARQVEVQAELSRQRDGLTAVEQHVKASESQRHAIEKRVAAEREGVEALRIHVRELEVRREALTERFAATGLVLAEVAAQAPADAGAEQWDQRLTQTRNSIERLGPINLAAIDEFSEQSERKTYLDSQHADLTSALETLEHAIRRIDRESRTRFQETFDNINSGLKRLFPRLFGGGHAYLTLEGEDLLSAGVTVMARPPGKRNSNIHLLSGGEKALTAVALIFSIFELNPAPFCLLDEVDAPLDEANVGRFCEIVREMSQNVQFIVITHNKTTMEMTKQLTGVTMNEPGVSRLVAVDIDEAVKLVAS